MTKYKTYTNDIKEEWIDSYASPSLLMQKFTTIESDPKAEQPAPNGTGKVKVRAVMKDEYFTRILNSFKREDSSCLRRSFPKWNFESSELFYKLEMKLSWRLTTSSVSGIVENSGISMDRFFSIPVIPGSGIKGVCLTYALMQWTENKNAQLTQSIVDIFGFPTNDKIFDQKAPEILNFDPKEQYAGKINFMAAYPTTNIRLSVDIVNTHHQDYYHKKEGKKFATDDEQPIPNKFLTAKESDFTFYLKKNKSCNDDIFIQAQKLLKNTLLNIGLGAKTNTGYGSFEEKFIFKDPIKEQNEKRAIQQGIDDAKRKEIAEKYQKEQDMKNAEILSQNIRDFENKNWKDLSKKLNEIFFIRPFDESQKEIILEILHKGSKLKFKDIEYGKKTLARWFGEVSVNEILESVKKEKAKG